MTITGIIHVIKLSDGKLQVVFTSLDGSGGHLVSDKAGAEHFIGRALGCSLKPGDMDRVMTNRYPNGIQVKISDQHFEAYFSK